MLNVRRNLRSQSVRLRCVELFGMKFFNKVALLLNNHLLVAVRQPLVVIYKEKNHANHSCRYSSWSQGKKMLPLFVLCSQIFWEPWKNVEIPATDEQLDKVLSNKAMFDGSSIEGFVRINESDMYLYPDLDTWTSLPVGRWKMEVLTGLICRMVYTTEGEPFAGDPRGNLKLCSSSPWKK